jgi:hypothetical protein
MCFQSFFLPSFMRPKMASSRWSGRLAHCESRSTRGTVSTSCPSSALTVPTRGEIFCFFQLMTEKCSRVRLCCAGAGAFASDLSSLGDAGATEDEGGPVVTDVIVITIECKHMQQDRFQQCQHAVARSPALSTLPSSGRPISMTAPALTEPSAALHLSATSMELPPGQKPELLCYEKWSIGL